MIDVMLLLVLYILSTVTRNRQQSIAVKLPKAATASSTHAVPPAVVTVAANGDIYLNKPAVTLN